MSVVIEVEDLGKLYRLGEVGTGTLSHDLKRWWALTRGKEDPYSQVGRVNIRTERAEKGEYVWALQNISFSIQKGDVVGIIGKNGAGKSTLLKILSRITAPTSGSLRIKGRVGSLLEVGTGFHPEMTGRENVFMNGTILGMRRHEIVRKFDDIVDFAGIAKYIDTPVKRYSSGMMVRLGFAVAAFLEPEILIVDEVLAVGDAEFQKRCLGKMEEVSRDQGRTILFVSHNMSSVNTLCHTGMFLANGQLEFQGDIQQVISRYLNYSSSGNGKLVLSSRNDIERRGNRLFGEIISISTRNTKGEILDTFEFGQQLYVDMRVEIKQEVVDPELGICISTSRGTRLQHLVSKWEREFGKIAPGVYDVTVELQELMVYPGDYTLTAWFRHYVKEPADDFIESALSIKVIKSEKMGRFKDFTNYSPIGGVYAKSNWYLQNAHG